MPIINHASLPETVFARVYVKQHDLTTMIISLFVRERKMLLEFRILFANVSPRRGNVYELRNVNYYLMKETLETIKIIFSCVVLCRRIKYDVTHALYYL